MNVGYVGAFSINMVNIIHTKVILVGVDTDMKDVADTHNDLKTDKRSVEKLERSSANNRGREQDPGPSNPPKTLTSIPEAAIIDMADALDIYPKEGKSLKHFIERKGEKGKLRLCPRCNDMYDEVAAERREELRWAHQTRRTKHFDVEY